MGFIERVLVEKQEEVAEKKRRRPLESLREALEAIPVRDFRAAVAADSDGGKSIIAELKARTPSIDGFAWSGRLGELAAVYREGGAAAISVVTDERNFGTSLETVSRVRDRVKTPILVKDFVFDPYQVFEARAHGADAVLLIVRILDWDRLTGLLDLVRQLGMDALVEAHEEAEVNTALQARASIVGVNNRDLDTLGVSVDVTARLARLVPDDVVLVAESGIRSGQDVDRLARAGANAFLVGEALLDADDPGRKLRELRGEIREGV
jgi:indole-3-glycerol phosphate synthase